jgi:hypothetical protein
MISSRISRTLIVLVALTVAFPAAAQKVRKRDTSRGTKGPQTRHD